MKRSRKMGLVVLGTAALMTAARTQALTWITKSASSAMPRRPTVSAIGRKNASRTGAPRLAAATLVRVITGIIAPACRLR